MSDKKDYTAACINCGSTKDLQLWPHRDKKDNMVGFIFLCEICASLGMIDKVGIWYGKIYE